MCETSKYAAVRRIPQENDLVAVHGNKGEPRTKKLDRKRNKTKIPAQVRNNLENALVGLCDVWFEEIKPHLLRHNIKVHCQHEVDEINEDTEKKPVRRCSHSHPLLNRIVEAEKHNEPKVYSMHSGSESPTSSSCEMCRLLLDAAAGIERAASQACGVPGAAAASAVYHHRHAAPAPAVPATAVPIPNHPF